MCLVPGVEGAFDLPAGEVVLAVDAVGADGEQQAMLRPARPAIWAGAAPAFSQGDRAACRRSQGQAGESGGSRGGPRTIDYVEELPRDPNGKRYKRRPRDAYWVGRPI
jgi:hypothetical protein